MKTILSILLPFIVAMLLSIYIDPNLGIVSIFPLSWLSLLIFYWKELDKK